MTKRQRQSGLFGALAIAALGTLFSGAPARADRIYTQCDPWGDRCWQVICDDFGDDCRPLRHRYYVEPPPVVVETPPPPPAPPAQAQYWYRCAKPAGFYPYVQQCPGGWKKVPATPPSK